jgi:hypothetical protein
MMTTDSELDCIQFAEYVPNECWKKADSGVDLTSTLWITLSSCTEVPKVIITNKSEKVELIFQKVGSTIRVKDNRLCYHKSNLVRVNKLS